MIRHIHTPPTTDEQQHSIDGRRLAAAIENLFDSGNSLANAWDDLLLIEDSYELELALIGRPEIHTNADNTKVRLNMDYYVRKLRELWMIRALAELEAEERHHGNRRQ